MIEEPTLLATIIADPDDDRTRLVYSDWLEEHGQRAIGGRLRECLASVGRNHLGRFLAWPGPLRLRRDPGRLPSQCQRHWRHGLGASRDELDEQGFERVLDELGGTRVGETSGEVGEDASADVELSNGEEAGVLDELGARSGIGSPWLIRYPCRLFLDRLVSPGFEPCRNSTLLAQATPTVRGIRVASRYRARR